MADSIPTSTIGADSNPPSGTSAPGATTMPAATDPTPKVTQAPAPGTPTTATATATTTAAPTPSDLNDRSNVQQHSLPTQENNPKPFPSRPITNPPSISKFTANTGRGTSCYPHIKFKTLPSGDFSSLPLSLRMRMHATKYKNLISRPSSSGKLPSLKSGPGFGSIIPLSHNKLLKLNASRNELGAMEFVRARTTIPLPTIYEVLEFPQEDDSSSSSSSSAAKRTNQTDENNNAGQEKIHIVMTQLPGSNKSYVDMTESQIRDYGKELAGYLEQLRSLEPPSEGYVGSVSGGSLIDHRVGHIPFGPFSSVSEFHDYLRLGGRLEDWTGGDVVRRVHGRRNLGPAGTETGDSGLISKGQQTAKHTETEDGKYRSKPNASGGGYSVKFTHADLNPSNILYDGTKITGIIDWEFAGWYPEYWEYTKMYFAEGRPAYANFFRAIQGEDTIPKYKEELEAERDIQGRVSPWGYDDYYGNLDSR